MRRGPPRKPAEKDLKLGNPSKRNKKALAAAAGTDAAAEPPPPGIEPPGYLPDQVKAIWRGYVTTAVGQRILKSGDLFALERLCTYWAEWRELSRSLQDRRTKSGFRLIETVERERYGSVTKLRAEAAYRLQLEQAIRQLEAQFGATPSARASVLADLANANDAPPTLPKVPGTGSANEKSASGVPPPPSSPIGTLGSGRQKLN